MAAAGPCVHNHRPWLVSPPCRCTRLLCPTGHLARQVSKSTPTRSGCRRFHNHCQVCTCACVCVCVCVRERERRASVLMSSPVRRQPGPPLGVCLAYLFRRDGLGCGGVGLHTGFGCVALDKVKARQNSLHIFPLVFPSVFFLKRDRSRSDHQTHCWCRRQQIHEI